MQMHMAGENEKKLQQFLAKKTFHGVFSSNRKHSDKLTTKNILWGKLQKLQGANRTVSRKPFFLLSVFFVFHFILVSTSSAAQQISYFLATYCKQTSANAVKYATGNCEQLRVLILKVENISPESGVAFSSLQPNEKLLSVWHNFFIFF